MTDETVVESDGVRVTKSFDADGFPVPAVRFDVVSTLDDETTLTITDEIPDEFDIDQIGFHPEYGSEHWTATGDGVVRFQRTIEAEEEFTTVYGVRMEDDEEPTAFLDTPKVTVGEDAESTGIEDVVPPESSDIVRELASGKRDSIPGLEDDEAEVAAPGDTNEPLLDALHDDSGEIVDAEAVEASVSGDSDDATSDSDAGEPEAAAEEEETEEVEPTVAEIAAGGTGADETSEHATEAHSGGDGGDTIDVDTPGETEAPVAHSERDPEADGAELTPEPVTAADVAAELAAQIRAGDVDDDDLTILREELAPKRANVQIEHLQTRVSEMEAYADALGAFIDENGDARGILEDLQSDVEDMESTVHSLESSIETADSERAELRETVSEVETRLEALDEIEERVDRVSGDVDALDERLGGVEDSLSEVDDLSEDVDDLRTEIKEMKQWRDQLSDVFGG